MSEITRMQANIFSNHSLSTQRITDVSRTRQPDQTINLQDESPIRPTQNYSDRKGRTN